MNVERTIEFIRQSQARAEVRMDRAELRMDRSEVTMHRLELEVKATANLVRQGMKTVQSLARERRQMRKGLREDLGALRQEVVELLKAQARTERILQRYLKSLTNGRNGRRRNGS